LIKGKDLTKIYWHEAGSYTVATHNVSFEIRRGDFAIITGRSGCGKTTLLSMIGGLTKPTKGKVFVEGIDVWSLNDRELSTFRNRKFGFIFQFPSLFPTLTVLENLLLPTLFSGLNEETYRHAFQLLKTVGLIEKYDAYPYQLSAGQQRRVAIARALINKPEIVLADEPTSDLDEDTEREIMELFKQINTDATILLVTHNPELSVYGNRHFRMSQGKLTEL